MLDSRHITARDGNVALKINRGGTGGARPFALVTGESLPISAPPTFWKLGSISHSLRSIVRELIEKPRRRTHLTGVAQRHAVDTVDYNPTSIDRSFQGWLSAVALPKVRIQEERSVAVRPSVQVSVGAIPVLELLSAPVFSHQPKERYPEPRVLTTQDYIQVMLATTREGHTHQRWPAGAFAKFMAADVITERK